MSRYLFARQFARTSSRGIGAAEGPVVLLGDSLSVGTSPHLKKLIPDLVTIAKVGASIDWMRSRADDVNAFSPRLVLVMGGTNDLAGGTKPAAVSDRMYSLVKAIDAPVIVGSVPTMTVREDAVRQYNEILETRFDYRPIGDVIDEDELTDGVHPGPSGYARMADAWSGSLRPRSNVRPFLLAALTAAIGYGVYRMAA